MDASLAKPPQRLGEDGEKHNRTLCRGCQDLKPLIFARGPWQAAARVDLHTNFAELSRCADTYCDLCAFIRREFSFYCGLFANNYTYSDEDLVGLNSTVYVEIRGCRDNPEVMCGTFPGPTLMFDDDIIVRHCQNSRERFFDVEQRLSLARQWLTKCQSEHEKCISRTESGSMYLPTRVLDVGQSGENTIRLVLSRDLLERKAHDYVTLSYCWGNANDTACTTATNIAQRLNAIPLDSLPKTIRDAVEVTRALGVRYLWVDALCILQVKEGRNEDWEHELLNMGKIYRYSLFTIAASSAKNSDEGLFYQRGAARWPIEEYHLVNEEGATTVLHPSLPEWQCAVGQSVLAQRGWVLQEDMLASRKLYWTNEGLFWRCTELAASEYEEKIVIYSGLPTLEDLAKNILEPGEHDMGRRGAWTDILEEFAQKDLTVATDRLPAVEGLGRAISEMTGKEMVMGVWKHNLVHELAWMADFVQRRGAYARGLIGHPKVARLPNISSWSWASVEERVYFRMSDSYGYSIDPPPRYEHLVANCQVHGDQVHVRGMLGVTRVRKTESSIAIRFDLECGPTPCTFEPVTARPNQDSKQQVAVFDTLSDTLPDNDGTIMCIQWIRWLDEHRATSDPTSGTRFLGEKHVVIGALIITPVDVEKKIYRRIGWLEVVDANFFDEEPQDIILV